MGPLVLIGGGLLALLVATRKKKPAIDREQESKMIGTELARLPQESRDFFFRLLLTVDPANDANTYAQAIVNATGYGLVFTAGRLTEIAKERFG